MRQGLTESRGYGRGYKIINGGVSSGERQRGVLGVVGSIDS